MSVNLLRRHETLVTTSMVQDSETYAAKRYKPELIAGTHSASTTTSSSPAHVPVSVPSLGPSSKEDEEEEDVVEIPTEQSTCCPEPAPQRHPLSTSGNRVAVPPLSHPLASNSATTSSIPVVIRSSSSPVPTNQGIVCDGPNDDAKDDWFSFDASAVQVTALDPDFIASLEPLRDFLSTRRAAMKSGLLEELLTRVQRNDNELIRIGTAVAEAYPNPTTHRELHLVMAWLRQCIREVLCVDARLGLNALTQATCECVRSVDHSNKLEVRHTAWTFAMQVYNQCLHRVPDMVRRQQATTSSPPPQDVHDEDDDEDDEDDDEDDEDDDDEDYEAEDGDDEEEEEDEKEEE
jgi:hypothetical protein